MPRTHCERCGLPGTCRDIRDCVRRLKNRLSGKETGAPMATAAAVAMLDQLVRVVLRVRHKSELCTSSCTVTAYNVPTIMPTASGPCPNHQRIHEAEEFVRQYATDAERVLNGMAKIARETAAGEEFGAVEVSEKIAALLTHWGGYMPQSRKPV